MRTPSGTTSVVTDSKAQAALAQVMESGCRLFKINWQDWYIPRRRNGQLGEGWRRYQTASQDRVRPRAPGTDVNNVLTRYRLHRNAWVFESGPGLGPSQKDVT